MCSNVIGRARARTHAHAHTQKKKKKKKEGGFSPSTDAKTFSKNDLSQKCKFTRHFRIHFSNQ